MIYLTARAILKVEKNVLVRQEIVSAGLPSLSALSINYPKQAPSERPKSDLSMVCYHFQGHGR